MDHLNPEQMMKIGSFVQEAMVTIEREVSELAGVDGIEVGEIGLVVEVRTMRYGQEFTGVYFDCTDTRRWLQAGLLQAALEAVDATDADESG